MKKNILQTTLALTVLSSFAQAEGGARITRTFDSPNGVTEACIAFEKLPLGDYKKKDLEEESRLCSFNLHDDSVALCPKTWSTSPGTIISGFRNVDGKNLANSAAEAEHSLCNSSKRMDTLAKFKQTMNQSDTSGTFSGSSILYYHFSRALDTQVTVPVAVYRSMDKDEHFRRVSAKANPPASSKMMFAGWNWIRSAEQNPAAYNSVSDLFTRDQRQIYGVLLKDKGERYMAEINGTRESGWGKGQNIDFQKTPAFFALRTGGNLESAIATGYQKAVANPKMKAAVPSMPSVPQMVLWMNEVSEVAILDFIFSQQDRIGNIDYSWYWSYVDQNGEVQAERVKENQYESLPRTKMSLIKPPASLAGKNAVLVQKTSMGDNDAGGIIQYANYAKSTGMLENLAHLNKGTYQRLLKLARDFKNKGANYQVLAREFAMVNVNDANRRLPQTVNNTILAASTLEKQCRAGTLKLDLVSFKKAMKNELTAPATNCSIED